MPRIAVPRLFRETRIRALVCTMACFFVQPAAAQTPAGPNDPPAEARVRPFTGELPGCADALVLAEIARKFWDRERDYWDSDLSLESFDAVRETGFRTRGASFIPRRHCAATARFNDGAVRQVIYTIGEDLGFIGYGWGVDWCVVGLDQSLAHAPACSAAGP